MLGGCHAGLAVAWEAESGSISDLGQSLPCAHGLDDVVVSVYLSVHALLPSAASAAVVAARVGVMGGRVGHRLGAAVAVRANAVLAVTLAIGNTHRSVVHKRVRRQHEFDLPVAICATEKLKLEISMLGDVFLTNENTACVAHVSGGGTWVLIVVAIELSHKSLRRNDPAASREFLGVIALPNLDLSDIASGKTSRLERVSEAHTVVVAGTSVAHQHVLLATEKHLEPGNPVIGQIATAQVLLHDVQNSGDGVGLNMFGCVHSESTETDAE